LIGLRISVSRSLWRLGPAWAVLAGALASSISLFNGDTLLRLLGAVVLADAAWGVFWTPLAGASGGEAAGDRPTWSLPYAHPAAPIGRLSRLYGRSWLGLATGLALTAGLATLLGGTALLLSLAALIVAFWALSLTQFDRRPALPLALLAVGLPWLLGLTLDGVGLARVPKAGLALAAAFTLLEWGVQRARCPQRSRGRGIWLGQAAVLTVLVGLCLPWAAAVVAALFLIPSWWLLRVGAMSPPILSRALNATRAPDPPAPSNPGEPAEVLARSAPWWWAALFLAAFALR
jgi:hypothetical protein